FHQEFAEALFGVAAAVLDGASPGRGGADALDQDGVVGGGSWQGGPDGVGQAVAAGAGVRDRAGVGVARDVEGGLAGGVGDLGDQEGLVGADVLGGHAGVLRVAQAHEAHGGVAAAAEALADVAGDRPVHQDEARAGGLAGVYEAVEDVAAQLLGAAEEKGVVPASAGRGLPDAVGQGGRDVSPEDAVGEDARAAVHRHDVQAGRGQAHRFGGEFLQFAELRLQGPGAADDDPVDGVPAEKRRDALDLVVGEQAAAQVVAGVADLGEDAQRGGDPRDRRVRAEDLDETFQDRVVERQVAGAALLLARADDQGQDVRERFRAQAAGEVEARQVGGQHPDEGVVAAVGGQAEEVVRDGAFGQGDDGEARPYGEAGGAHGGDGGGPSGEGPADDVDAVHAGRDGDRVPLALALVRRPAALPVGPGLGVGLLGRGAFPFGLGAPAFGGVAFLGDAFADGHLVPPQGPAGDGDDDRAGQHPDPRERPRNDACEAAQQEQEDAAERAAEHDPQRQRRHVLARPPLGRRRRAGFGRVGAFGGRPRVGVHLRVTPAHIDAVGL